MKGKGPQEGGGKQEKWLIHTLNVYVPQDTKTTQERWENSNMPNAGGGGGFSHSKPSKWKHININKNNHDIWDSQLLFSQSSETWIKSSLETLLFFYLQIKWKLAHV